MYKIREVGVLFITLLLFELLWVCQVAAGTFGMAYRACLGAARALVMAVLASLGAVRALK